MAKKRVFGWVPDLPDARDRYLSAKPGAKLPVRVDLRELFTPVEDQGNIGSCTAQAYAGVLEYLDHKKDDQWVDVSRLYIYYNERRLINEVGNDSGARLRDGIKALKRWGACREDLWPYDPSAFTTRPPQSAYKDGASRKITAYYRCNSLYDIRYSLNAGYPVAFGFSVYDSFMNIGRDGIMPMPDFNKESLNGGHAVVACGFDDEAQHLIVRNSWGNRWGDQGYFYMPYAYVFNDLSDDFWTVTNVEDPLKVYENEPDVYYIPIISIFVWLYEKIKGKLTHKPKEA